MAVEKDQVDVRLIVVSTIISAIVIAITVFLVEGWFERFQERSTLDAAIYDGSHSRRIEGEQLDSIDPSAPVWKDRDSRTASLPLSNAMDLTIESEKARQSK